MKKAFLAVMVLAVLASGCASENSVKPEGESENDTSSDTGSEIDFSSYEIDGDFRIVEEDGTEYLLYREGELYATPYLENLRSSVDWIAENTQEDAKIAVWWDYSHMVKGIADREVMADGPSEKALETTAGDTDYDNWGGLDSNDELRGLATIFTGSIETSKTILEGKDVDYLLMSKLDIKKYAAINEVGGGEENRIIDTFECKYECPPENGSLSTFKPSYGGGNTRVTAEIDGGGLESLETSGRLKEVKCSEGKDENCFMYSFGNLFYVPSSESDSMMVELLSSEVKGLEQVYSSEDAKIWKLQQ